MNLKLIKKSIATVISCALLFVSAPHVKTFAALKDIEKLGGSYEELLEEKENYRDYYPDDHTVYECHHLIAREALNRWGNHIYKKAVKSHKCAITRYNAFLVKDSDQLWAPAITMEKADHERTLSYYNRSSSPKQKDRAIKYINRQAYRIIKYGDIIGVLKDEIKFIRKTFPNKYDRAIDEVWQYINSLECRHLGGKTLVMKNPYNDDIRFYYHFG